MSIVFTGAEAYKSIIELFFRHVTGQKDRADGKFWPMNPSFTVFMSLFSEGCLKCTTFYSLIGFKESRKCTFPSFCWSEAEKEEAKRAPQFENLPPPLSFLPCHYTTQVHHIVKSFLYVTHGTISWTSFLQSHHFPETSCYCVTRS